MINKYKQTICNVSKIILDDGVTLLPGYVEVNKGKIYQHYSNDPNNSKQKPGLLKNRVGFRRVEERGKSPLKKDYHFVDMKLYKSLADKLK